MLPRTGSNMRNGVYVSYSLKLSIANNDMRLLDIIKNSFGGRIEQSTTPKHVDTTNWNVGYRIRWFGKEAMDLINMSRPYLIVKAEQADLAQAFIDLQRKTYRSNDRSDEDIAVMASCALQMKALNKRGL